MKKAFSQEGRSIEAVWEEYLPKEQKIYEYILGEKVTKLEGTIAELAARFDMTAEMIVAFIDGLNASLEEPFDMETLAEDTKVCINIDFEKLYKLMIEYKAERVGIKVKYVDPAFTSQTCSKCGYVDEENRITQDKFECQKCGFTLNADHNAAINIARK